MSIPKTTTKSKSGKSVKRTIPVRLKDVPENAQRELPDLELHVFDDRNNVLGKTCFHGTKTEIELEPGRSRLVRAVLAPAGLEPNTVLYAKSLPSKAMEVASLDLLEFQNNWWENLILGFPIFYHGTVEKVFGGESLPICEGTVEVYEVDPWKWIITLPDLEVLKLRDDLLEKLKEVEVPLPLPAPNGFRTIDTARLKPKVSSHPQLALLEGAQLRNYLTIHKAELLPYLCLIHPPWFYMKQKLGEVEIQPDGTFSGSAGWWLPGQDRPDLYFRVKQTIGGTEKYIYNPSVSCHTWWNYSGQLVPIRVYDVEAIACDHPGPAVGNQVVILGIGFDKTTDETVSTGVLGTGLLQEGANKGLYRYGGTKLGKLGPYGKTLHVALDVDPAGMQAAGARFYRVSWKAGNLTNTTGTGWEPMSQPIARHHKIISGTDVTYPLESLTPTAAELPPALAAEQGIFKLPPFGLDYKVISAADRAYGIWDTTELHSGGVDPGTVAGIYTLRVEVFDASGSDITSTLPFKRLSKPLPGGGMDTDDTTGGQPLFWVHVDNRKMVAEINDLITADTSTTTTGCGFLHAMPRKTVDFNIRAFHPDGVGYPGDTDRFLEDWSFIIHRGSAAIERVNLVDAANNVGSPSTWHALPNGGLPDMTVHHLLDGVVPPPGTERRCAFAVILYVNTLTRNGYNKIESYDARDTAAFALIDDGSV